MKENTKKTIYLGAAAFISSVIASVLFAVGIPILPAVVMCVTAGCFAATATVSPSKLHLALIPVCVGCAFLITLDAFMTVISAAPLVAGIIIGTYAKKGKAKTAAVIMADIAYGAVLSVGLALAYLIAKKTLAPSSIAATVGDIFDRIGAEMKTALENIKFYEMYSRVYEITIGEEEFLNAIVKETMFVVKAVSPGVIISALNVISYVSAAFYSLAAKICKTEIDGVKWVLFPKVGSAWVAVLSAFLYMLLNMFATSDFFTAVQIAALNMMIILVPPFFICGINGLKGRFRSPRFKIQAIVITVIASVMIVISFPAGPAYSAVFISLVGAWDIITFHRLSKMQNNSENNEQL